MRIMRGHHVMIILALLVSIVPVYAESSTKVNLIVDAVKITKMFYSKRGIQKCIRIMEGHHVIIILTLLVCMVPVYAESSTKVNLIVGAIKSTKMFHSKRILLGPLNNDQSNIRESFKFFKAVQALNDGTTLIMGFKNTSKFLSTFNGLVVIPWEIDNAQLCWLATNKFLMDNNSILALVKSADDIRKKLESLSHEHQVQVVSILPIWWPTVNHNQWGIQTSWRIRPWSSENCWPFLSLKVQFCILPIFQHGREGLTCRGLNSRE